MITEALLPELLVRTGNCPACGGAGCDLCGRSQGVNGDLRQVVASEESSHGESRQSSEGNQAAPDLHLSRQSTSLMAVDLEASIARSHAGDTDHAEAADSRHEHEHGAEEEEESSESIVSSLVPVVDGAASEEEMSAQELDDLRELQQRDREVRAHEQAHISAGGQHAGGATFTYETGPDGQQYAVGGEVSIDTSKVPGDPDATAEKARTVRRAALAPASPSAQDMKVASQASNLEAEARVEQQQEQREEQTTGQQSPLGGIEASGYASDEIRHDPAALAQADLAGRPLDSARDQARPQETGLAVELAREQETAQPVPGEDSRSRLTDTRYGRDGAMHSSAGTPSRLDALV